MFLFAARRSPGSRAAPGPAPRLCEIILGDRGAAQVKDPKRARDAGAWASASPLELLLQPRGRVSGGLLGAARPVDGPLRVCT